MKKTVLYSELIGTPEINTSAWLRPIDHPDVYNVTNGGVVRTSRVVSYNPETGEIETMNTIYKKETV